MGVLQNLEKVPVGYKNLIELTEVPGIVAQVYTNHGNSGRV